MASIPSATRTSPSVTPKRKGRLTIDAELHKQNVFAPEYLEEVYDFPDGNFALIHHGRQVGIGFKQTYDDGDVRLCWIKRSDLLRLGNAWQEKAGNSITAAAIPPERYSECPFLRS